MSVHDHLTDQTEIVAVDGQAGRGHGGGDDRLIRTFADAIRGEKTDGLTSARSSLESHLLAFAAERSRTTGATVDMTEYRHEYSLMPQVNHGAKMAPRWRR